MEENPEGRRVRPKVLRATARADGCHASFPSSVLGGCPLTEGHFPRQHIFKEGDLRQSSWAK